MTLASDNVFPKVIISEAAARLLALLKRLNADDG